MGKIFGIGLSKTGTKTLAACLRELGYRHKSWDEPFAKRVLVEGDVEALDREAERYDSFDDLPWPLFYRRLDARYPDARFVLTLRRSPEEWYESLRRHAEYKGPTAVREHVYGHIMPHGHRDEHIEVYERHRAEVIDYFSGRPGKLLVLCWQEEPSWRPLCDFLGQSAPDKPLPHENRRRKARLKRYARRLRYGAQAAAEKLLGR